MRTVFVVGVLACAGCRVDPSHDPPPSSTSSNAVEVEAEPAPSQPEVSEVGVLPCTVELSPDQAAILVAGQPLPIELEQGTDTHLVAYPAGADQVLIAVGHPNPWYPDRTTTGESLWRVSCAAPSQLERAIELPGADFSASVLTPDGKHILFSDGGVASYSIETGKIEAKVGNRAIADCWMNEGPSGSEEFVQGWAQPGELLVLSGGPCGFEAIWEGEVQVVSEFDDPSKPAKRRHRAWVGALALGADARLWVGNGDECSLDFKASPSGTPGVWRSTDAGASWTFLPLPGIQAGVAQLWPSASDPDRVLAVTECCSSMGSDGCEPNGGGGLFLTSNAGKTWRKILDPVFNVRVDEAGHEITAVTSDDIELKTVVTRDDGKTWTPSTAVLGTSADPRPKALEVGEFVVEATEDGVRRRAKDAAAGSGEIVLRPGVDSPP